MALKFGISGQVLHGVLDTLLSGTISLACLVGERGNNKRDPLQKLCPSNSKPFRTICHGEKGLPWERRKGAEEGRESGG